MKDHTPLELRTGVLWQDLQHGVFFYKINAVRQAIQTDQIEKIGKILASLESYAQDHFSLEEAYMAEGPYAEQQNHISEHRRFQELVLAARLEWQNIADKVDWREIAEDLSVFLEFWLKRHIGNRDQALVPHIHRVSHPARA